MNKHGLDVRYFEKKLNLIVRDLNYFKPDELSRALMRLAESAYDQRQPQSTANK